MILARLMIYYRDPRVPCSAVRVKCLFFLVSCTAAAGELRHAKLKALVGAWITEIKLFVICNQGLVFKLSSCYPSLRE